MANMNSSRIDRIASLVAESFVAASGKLHLGPQKKSTGRKSLSWHQKFRFNPEGWELDQLMPKIVKYLKNPPADRLNGYAAPQWFIQFNTKRGVWPVKKWNSKNKKTYQKLVEDGELTGTGVAGWLFSEEG